MHSAWRETLNRISKIINETYAGWMGMIQGFQIYFPWNPRLKGVEGPCWGAQPIQPKLGQSRPNWLCFLTRPFHAPQSKILCKIYLEFLNHTCSPCIGPIDDFWNLCKVSLSSLPTYVPRYWHLDQVLLYFIICATREEVKWKKWIISKGICMI